SLQASDVLPLPSDMSNTMPHTPQHASSYLATKNLSSNPDTSS
ncbi:hypothetical protein A2U01_0101360, partial [Trifolium medium]|nr:hypothetical protein [Trifolium medium]